MYYAQINNGTVVAITESAEQIVSPDVVEIPNFDTSILGWSYVGGDFVEPTPPVVPETRHITKLAFRNRFTTTEKVTIEIACLDDPTAPMAQRQMAAALRSSQSDINAATYIDLDRQDTRDGVLALEAAGLLAAGRALIILDDPITATEIYKG